MGKKEIRKKVKEFLEDKSKKKLEMDVPENFSIYSIRNPIAVWFRKTALAILSKVPPMHIKTWLFNILGYDFRKDTCLPGFIFIDEYFPELISLKPGVLVGGFATIKPWKLEKEKLILGRIDIAKRTLLSGWTRIGPGVTINEHVITGSDSTLTKDVPKDSFVVGTDRIIKTWSKEEIERHFGESKHDPEFGKKIRKLMKDFRKDKKQRTVRFRNDGNRLNAGCEWWRARPVWQIYWQGIFVELSLLLPFSEKLRKLCYWIMGVRWGRNFKLGKRVYFDHIYGNTIRIGDNVTIEDDAFIDGHEYTTTETVYGRTIIKDNAHIKKGAYIREGLIIRNNAVIEEKTVIMKDVGENETWAGSPAKQVDK